MVDVSKLRPTSLEDCLIQSSSLHNLLDCNFANSNVLLRGKAGVGKTLICDIIKKEYPHVIVNENVKSFRLIAPTISTTTKPRLYSSVFHKIIDIHPISKLILLKTFSGLAKKYHKSDIRLFHCINLHYPNINKILNCFLNEN